MAETKSVNSDTSEMKMLIFRIAETFFGISVAKVREVIERTKTTPLPKSPAVVEGIFQLRDEVRILINLGMYFGYEGDEIQKGKGSIIVIEFNKVRCGILVDAVDVIHSMQWKDIDPPSEYLIELGAPITGTVEVNKRTVLIVDFEDLIGEILGLETTFKPMDSNIIVDSNYDIRIILAEDSAMLRKSLSNNLRLHGFKKLTICSDGQQAWNAIQDRKGDENGPCELVITDIEMPRMDGVTLTSNIKNDPQLKDIPVVIYSSLISENRTGSEKATDADAYVGKPETEEMIQAVEACLKKRGILHEEKEEELVPA